MKTSSILKPSLGRFVLIIKNSKPPKFEPCIYSLNGSVFQNLIIVLTCNILVTFHQRTIFTLTFCLNFDLGVLNKLKFLILVKYVTKPTRHEDMYVTLLVSKQVKVLLSHVLKWCYHKCIVRPGSRGVFMTYLWWTS